jgi:zeaxanthin glucosyltransferase
VRIAFATLAAAGHYNPMTALARKVRERGHEVFFIGIPDCEPPVRVAGFEFRSFGERQFPAGSRRIWEAHLSRLHGLAGCRFTLEHLIQGFETVVREVPSVLHDARAEAVVADELLFGILIAAAQLHLPVIQIANALPAHQYDSIPLPVVDWPYRSGAFARLRNRAGYAVLRHFLKPFRAVVEQHCRRHGVPFDSRDPNAGLSNFARISQLPSAFDFPNAELPPWFHYTGPFHDGLGRAEVEFPWGKLTGEPLIYSSMGTIQNGDERVFRMIAEACSGLGYQVVLSLGENVASENVGPLAGNCVAVAYAPQLELLRRAALCITHAGLNTALESLAMGVPMVALPITNDQPGVAARIVYTRTGTALRYRRLNPVKLRRAVRQVLEDTRYRENARRVQTAIQAANGLERATDIIEAALSASKPVGIGLGQAEAGPHLQS